MLPPAVPVRLILLADFTGQQNVILKTQNQPIPMQVSNIRPRHPTADGSVSATGCWCLQILHDSNVEGAMALVKSLEFAIDLLYLSLQSESDSSNVIATLKNK
ncbi:hypothetical protein TSUD_20290 [Trifolium subterraneum]|uniref:Uncharacterized protein n=1 Tax=Trifolium subterraneum TaxID=3900 RepID=A0A2Z6NCF2_TRISU|nr:hypothetical protein TSUD_20290 [Trifolium subterraneum]